MEERCSNIADRNTEIIKITNMLYLDSEINHILSEKQQLTGYEATQAQGKIQGKMRELTELFPERQYQIMILCSNGNSYFQNSLEFTGDRPTLKRLWRKVGIQKWGRAMIPFIFCRNIEVLYCKITFKRIRYLQFVISVI